MSNTANPTESGGGFFNGLGGLIAAIVLGLLAWPMLLPLAGTGENFGKIVPLNWILEALWLVAVVVGFRVTHSHHRRQGRTPEDS